MDSLKKYVYDRRGGLAKTAGVVAGFYLVRGYVGERLEEVKARLEQQRVAEDNLRRRFRQNQEDVSYTVMALLPTLADQILGGMDVEALTRELQSRSRAQRRPALSQASSSAEMVHEVDARSEAESSVASTSYSAPASELSTSGLQSWVEAGGNGSSSARSRSADRSNAGGSAMSDSFLSTASAASSTQSKAELWQEVKMLALTRTLTTLYATTLLCLLTSLQLTLLARHKYVAAVRRAAREEDVRERLEQELSLSSLLMRGASGGLGGGGLEELMSGELGEL